MSSHIISQFPLLLALLASMMASMIPYLIPTPPALGLYGSNHRITFLSSVSPSNLSFQRYSQYILGAALYNFFDNYSQSCLTTTSCQTQIVDISSDSEVYMSSLSTVGATYQVSVDQTPVVDHGANANGFAQTVTYWSSN